MKKQLSDEQLDNLMRTLMSDAAVDESIVNNIADSPTLWWGVQRQINEQKGAVRSPWPPVLKFRRWLMIGLPATAVASLLIAFYVMRNDTVPVEQANSPALIVNSNNHGVSEPVKPVVVSTREPETVAIPVRQEKTVATKARFAVKQPVSTAKTVGVIREKRNIEIKTEFIALSYARSPESGQIVRVRVPGSMMVTLGLVAAVEKPANLVDAEVLVGDDGTTHSIRFIRR